MTKLPAREAAAASASGEAWDPSSRRKWCIQASGKFTVPGRVKVLSSIRGNIWALTKSVVKSYTVLVAVCNDTLMLKLVGREAASERKDTE